MGLASPPTRGPVGSVERSADFEVAPLANEDTQRHPAAEDITGPCRYNLFGPCRLQVCHVAFCGGVSCCGPKLRNGGGVQKRSRSGVGNRWRASSKCQEEETEGKEAKEEEEDTNEEWWQGRRKRFRRGRQRGYGKERRGCSTSVRQTEKATLDRDTGGSVVLLLPVCAFVNARSFSSKNIFARTFEGSCEEKSTTFRKQIFRAFRWLQAESKERNPQKYLC